MPFQKGHKLAKGGRKPGSKNKATTEMGQWVMGVFQSDAYRKMCEKRLVSGSAGPIETYWANRLFGKPKETVSMNLTGETVHVHEHYWTDQSSRVSM